MDLIKDIKDANIFFVSPNSIMSFRTAGKPIFPTDKEEKSWFNHQAGYIVKTTYSPNEMRFATELAAYNLPMFMQETAPATPLMVPQNEGLNIVGGNGLYNGHDNSIRAINRDAIIGKRVCICDKN
jgi:hypothetical protein